MPDNRQFELRCPICKNPVKPEDSEFPFCSGRCRTIDLGKWASGAYAIPSSPVDEEQERFSEGAARRDQDEDL